jgi:formylglycine-generating enzyme required for sulfatase activity
MLQKLFPVLFLFLLITVMDLYAQNTTQLQIEGKATLDQSAIIPSSKKDVNGRQVAGIKVLTNLPSLSFDSGNGVVEVQQQAGAFIVFVSPNERKLTIVASGYLPLDIILSEIGIRLQSGQLWEITVTAEQQKEDLSADLETLIISSEPKGATIYINGIESGKTDASFFKLPNSYKIRWVLNGYLSQEQDVEVKAGQANKVEINLQKNTGLFTWNVKPNDAQILINKLSKEGNRLELAPSDYLVEVMKEGYEPIQERITIELGQSLSRSYELTRNTANLLINVKPVDAKVSISGKGLPSYEFEGIKSLKQIPAGTYSVIVQKNGFKTILEDVLVRKDESVQRTFILEKGRNDIDFTNSIGMQFVYVSPGSFDMGSNDGENYERLVHKVEITKGFYIGKYEVTQAQWREVMGTNPSYFQGSRVGRNYLNHPVEQVSWDDIQLFIQKLNQIEGKGLYRLPTEAEWEYAAKGGNQSQNYRYAGSNTITKVAWFGDNANKKTSPVGLKAPNELGIYDMSGNVWEWCQDWHNTNYYNQSPRQDPQGARRGEFKMIRGGSWFNISIYARVANRSYYQPNGRFSSYGFRLIRIPD